MQQQDMSNQPFSSNMVQKRPLRERVGVYVQANDTEEAIAKIRVAEHMGIHQIWMAMGGAGFADVLTVLAVAASQTERIKLGTAIVPAYPRHPLVTAQQALAIHDLAPARLRLGVGSGDRSFFENNYGLPQTTPLKYLKEYLQVLRGILWNGSIHYQGSFFQATDTLPRTAQIPILMPALGLKAFQLAGEVADGALASLSPVPYLLDQALPALRAGAAASKRPAPPIVACLPIAIHTDETAAIAALRPMLQYLIRTHTYAHMFIQAGWSAAINGDTEQLDELARSLLLNGNAASIQSRIRELLASGLDELVLLHIPVVNQAGEYQRFLDLIGSL